MPQAAPKQDIDPTLFATLHEATRRYRLNNKFMSNAEVAEHLELGHCLGDHMALPNCCFFLEGRLVAIRTKQDEVSIFHLWQRFQRKMEEIGTRTE